ncbi:MAG TPA: hypothetical protein VNS29_15290 [Burkholderiaceae bacterium]|nr:hypothetical protein [Burkholderiaceae bacterium]
MNFKELKARIRLAWQILKNRDGNDVSHAQHELHVLGYFDGDEINALMAECVLDLIRTLSTQGHSGHSASFCRSLFAKAAAFEPLGPLTGADSEWVDVGEQNGNPLYQNKRCGHVFKEGDRAYDIDGVVFEEPDGARFTGRHSRVPVTFPYVPRTVLAKVAADATDEDKMLAAQHALATA